MKKLAVMIGALLVLFPVVATAGPLAPGLYRNTQGQAIYVGTENERPDPAVGEFFNAKTHAYGDLPANAHLSFQQGIEEDRSVLIAPQGKLGVSLWRSGLGRRPTIILIHGNDDETREMGFLIPYFVLHGINVITYDQRGTGASSGNWQFSGPVQRAHDVEAIFDKYAPDPNVDEARLGVWGFSNGGWTAPIVARERPVAFMILKSAPADSIEENITYEVTQRMHHHHYAGAALAQALQAWQTLFGALTGSASWARAQAAYEAAKAQPWFAYSELPPQLSFPIPASLIAGFRQAVDYDPSATLKAVKVPTLALYGARDRSVGARRAAQTLHADFSTAGMRDFTVHVFSEAGHTLVVSASGYSGDASLPQRLPSGYPELVIAWLRQRGFVAR